MAEAQSYTGSCHCGADRLHRRGRSATGAQMQLLDLHQARRGLGLRPQEQVQADKGEDKQGDYQFNKKRLHHHFCTELRHRKLCRGHRPGRLGHGRHKSALRRRRRCRQAEPTCVGRPQQVEETSMTVSQADKAKKLRALHEAPGAFVIANPWDAGSARLLAGLGFQALATSSGAKAGVLGKRDGKVSREEALANASAIAEAVDLPVIGDLEKGFGDSPDAAAETIRQAAGVGLVGGSIEDATGNKDAPLLRLEAAAVRVKAAVKAAHALSFPVRADGARRGLPARQARPRRRHQAPAGLRGGGRRRAVRARPARSRRGEEGLRARSTSRSTSWSASRAGRSARPSSRPPA